MTNKTKPPLSKIQSCEAWVVVKEKLAKDKYGNYKKVYKITPYDVFADKDMILGKDEFLYKAVIKAIK